MLQAETNSLIHTKRRRIGQTEQLALSFTHHGVSYIHWLVSLGSSSFRASLFAILSVHHPPYISSVPSYFVPHHL